MTNPVVQCSCGGRFAAEAHLIGQSVACPKCGLGLIVPAAQASVSLLPPITVSCHCGQQFQADASLAGKSVQCTSCYSSLKVPTPGNAVTSGTSGPADYSSQPSAQPTGGIAGFKTASHPGTPIGFGCRIVNNPQHWALFELRNRRGEIAWYINAFSIVPYLVSITAGVFSFFVGMVFNGEGPYDGPFHLVLPALITPATFVAFQLINTWVGPPDHLFEDWYGDHVSAVDDVSPT